MTLRRRIARWLDPDVDRESDRLTYLLATLSEGYRWLGEIPDAVDTIAWISEQDRNHWRPLGMDAVNTVPWEIAAFREHLRDRAKWRIAKVEGMANDAKLDGRTILARGERVKELEARVRELEIEVGAANEAARNWQRQAEAKY